MSRQQKVGVIDIGSNSVRLVIYEQSSSYFTPIYNEKVLAGLGRDLHITGRLHEDGTRLAMAALRRFKALAGSQNLASLLIAATAALRDADDAPAFIERVSKELGMTIKPLSGEREAYLSAMGVVAGDACAHGICADLGGASLELISVAKGETGAGISFPLGPFSLYKGRFDPQVLRPRINGIFGGDLQFSTCQNLYLIGGAWRNLALIHQKNTAYPLRIAHNYTLDIEAAQVLSDWAVSEDGTTALLSWPGVSVRRAETLPYAGLMLGQLLERLRPRQIIIAAGGLRDGVLYDNLSEAQKQRNSLFDACKAFAAGRQESTGFSGPLFQFLAEAADNMPTVFSKDNENRLRCAACLLGGIGKGLHPGHKARMVFRSVLYAPLPSLTHKERAYLALMLFGSYTSKEVTPNADAIAYLLTQKEQACARVYGEAIRLATQAAGRSSQVLAKLRLTARGELTLSAKVGHELLLSEKTDERLTALRYRLAAHGDL